MLGKTVMNFLDPDALSLCIAPLASPHGDEVGLLVHYTPSITHPQTHTLSRTLHILHHTHTLSYSVTSSRRPSADGGCHVALLPLRLNTQDLDDEDDEDEEEERSGPPTYVRRRSPSLDNGQRGRVVRA